MLFCLFISVKKKRKKNIFLSSKDDYVSRTYFIFLFSFSYSLYVSLVVIIIQDCCLDVKESLPLWIQFVFDTFLCRCLCRIVWSNSYYEHYMGTTRERERNCLKLNIRIYMFTLLIYNRFLILSFFIIIHTSEWDGTRNTLNIKIWRRCFVA